MSKSVTFPYACHVKPDISCCVCDDPMIPITLSYGGKNFRTDGLVDSGCSIAHANLEIAELLGVNLDLCLPASSVGISGNDNPVSAYMTDIEFEVEKMGKPFVGRILFVEKLPYPLLLGQEGFFDNFDVLFQKSQSRFTITRV